jgi:hypothetical protein
MPRGPNLTPEQIGRLAEVYTRDGTFEAAGKAAKVDPSVARRALQRLGWSDLVGSNARALQAGCEAGRAALARNLQGLDAEQKRFARITRERRSLVEASGKGEDKKLAAQARLSRERVAVLVGVAKGLNLTVGRIESLADQALGARQKKLTREKTRAEIDALKKGTLLTTEQLLAYLAALPREELLTLIATLKARREAPAASATPPASATPTTPPPAAT